MICRDYEGVHGDVGTSDKYTHAHIHTYPCLTTSKLSLKGKFSQKSNCFYHVHIKHHRLTVSVPIYFNYIEQNSIGISQNFQEVKGVVNNIMRVNKR